MNSYVYNSQPATGDGVCFGSAEPERVCAPEMISPTICAIPSNPNILKSNPIPLGLIFSPFAETDANSVRERLNLVACNTHQLQVTYIEDTDLFPILRCDNRSCRAFVNPYCLFMNNLEKWKCVFCGIINKNHHLTLQNNRLSNSSCSSRLELKSCCVDYLASSEFLKRPPVSPTFVFLLEVSKSSVASGVLHIATNTLRQILQIMPVSERTRVCFITFDSNVHFYDVTSPTIDMLIVGSTDTFFVPPGYDFLLNRMEFLESFQVLLDKIPGFFLNSQQINTSLYGALRAANLILSNSGGGRILMFLTSTPESKADGVQDPTRIQVRVTPQNYNKFDESVYLKCNNTWYKHFGQRCASKKILIDLFAFASAEINGCGGYLNLAVISQLVTSSHGQLYYYPQWNAMLHGERFCRELEHHLMKPTTWDVYHKLKITAGLTTWGITEFYPCFAFDKSLNISLKVTDVIGSSKVFIQNWLFYTTSHGDRRIRVFTTALPVASSSASVCAHADPYAITAFISRVNLAEPFDEALKSTRKKLNDLCIYILLSKKNFSKTIALPESFQVIPPIALAFMKSDYLIENRIWPDIKVATAIQTHFMSKELLFQLVYPSLYEVYSADSTEQVDIWQTKNLTSLILTNRSIFLLDNGQMLMLHIGSAVPPHFIEDLFGVHDKLKIVNENLSLRSETLINDECVKGVVRAVEAVKRSKMYYQSTIVSFELLDCSNTRAFMRYMIEDSWDGLPSYQQYVANLLEVARRLGSKY